MLHTDTGRYFEYEIIGEFHSAGEWLHPERRIESFELIFALEGSVYLEEDGVAYTLHPNELLLLEPHKLHRGTLVSTQPVGFYWFHFYTDLPLPCKTFGGQEFYDVKYLLRKLLHLAHTPLYSRESADALGLLIFEELSALCRQEALEGNALIQKTAEYIRMNRHRILTVGEIAARFGYNADYMGKLFRQQFQVGLKEYLAAEKIRQAKDLLLTTGLSVKETAAQLGFGSENLFIKFFLYHEQISPTRFRNRYANTHMNNR